MSVKELDSEVDRHEDGAANVGPSSEPSSASDTGNFSQLPRVQVSKTVKKDDQELISDCLSGRTEAFGQLVTRYQNRLYNTLVHVLRNTEDAQDVCQDAFVHAFQKLETFRGQAAFYSWLFRIAMNAAVSRKRKTKRMKASVDAAKENLGEEPADPHPTARPSHLVEQDERRQLVHEALSQLSEEFRTVLVLKEMDGLKYEEIAEMIDCPIGTVRSRIHRARLELKQKLEILLRGGQP